MDLMVGGQASHWGGAKLLKKHSNIGFIPSLTELEKFIINA